ncbi:EXO1_1 [Blepharisma stoltei]|uniref:Exonuclease 1 n=1 Tax=Blepharisma stoltei TaxID=1481888 RepID=A0AAU9IS87_9CILI|nr:unnamed protein product [Blepharisma stoltei]
MGIQSLLQFLKPLLIDKHISEYSGQRIAIDSYCWLHKAVYSCGRDLIQGKNTKRHIDYCVKKALELRKIGVEPVMVFDGAPMPCKADTNHDRRQTRQEAMDKAVALDEAGNIREAEKFYSKAVSVTPDMANELIEELKSYGIECITAPYEADAQLAYLYKIGYVSAVISEDSDLLVFGCEKVLYKFDTAGGGSLKEMDLRNLHKLTQYNMKNWNHEQFMMMCILAGCDYLKSFKNVGIKTAYKIISQTIELDRIAAKLKIEPSIREDYQKQFLKAVYAFKFHRVYDPFQRKMVMLNEMDVERIMREIGDLDFLGRDLEPELARMVAESEVHPLTKNPFRAGLKRKYEDNFPMSYKKFKPNQPSNVYQQIRAVKNFNESEYHADSQDSEIPTPNYQTQIRPIQLKPLMRKPPIVLKMKKKSWDIEAEINEIRNALTKNDDEEENNEEKQDTQESQSAISTVLLPFATNREECNQSQIDRIESQEFLGSKKQLILQNKCILGVKTKSANN